MDKSNQIQNEAIELFHFDPKWFGFELLPLEFFELQIRKYRSALQGKDDFSGLSLEHYRYTAFCTLLATRKQLSDSELDQYIELCQLDEDQGMSQPALIDLLFYRGLTDDQYQRIIYHPAFSTAVAQKIIWRQKMAVEISRDAISDAAFAAILERQDSVFERKLVESEGISRQQLEVLAEKGANRAVRNMASHKAKGRA